MMNGHEVMLDAVRKRLQELVDRYTFIPDKRVCEVVDEIEQFQRAVDGEKEPITWNLEDGE